MLNSRKKIETDDDDDVVEAILQAKELSKLQCKLRRMQTQKKLYVEDTKVLLKKQEKEISALTESNTNLDDILRIATCKKNRVRDAAAICKLQELLQTYDEIMEEVEMEKQQIAELEKQIRLLSDKVQEKKCQMGITYGLTNEAIMNKQTRIVENHLEKATVDFNKQMAYNEKLRKQIDDLRHERVFYDNFFKMFSKELKENWKNMLQEMIEATACYEERDESQSKMVILQERNEQEKHQHKIDLKEMDRVLDHEKKLREFMVVKSQDRTDYKKKEEKKKKEAEKDLDFVKCQLEIYEEALERVKEMIGENDMNIIVTNFVQKEDENFALFNFVNEINVKVETLNEEISELKNEIERFKSEDELLQTDQKVMLKEMEEAINKVSEEADKLEKSTAETSLILDHLKEGVASLFKIVGCDPTPINEMLAMDRGVTDNSIFAYMGLIEQRTIELLQISAFMDMMKEAAETDHDEQPQQKTYSTHRRVSLPVDPPSTKDDDDDTFEITDEAELRPLSQAELKTIIKRQIKKQKIPIQS